MCSTFVISLATANVRTMSNEKFIVKGRKDIAIISGSWKLLIEKESRHLCKRTKIGSHFLSYGVMYCSFIFLRRMNKFNINSGIFRPAKPFYSDHKDFSCLRNILKLYKFAWLHIIVYERKQLEPLPFKRQRVLSLGFSLVSLNSCW